MDVKIWANSGDSHIVEPPTCSAEAAGPHPGAHAPQREGPRAATSRPSTSTARSSAASCPSPSRARRRRRGASAASPPAPKDSDEDEYITRVIGANDPESRLKDLDDEGVWAEVIYPSLGIWAFNIRTPEVAREGVRVINEFVLDFQQQSPRFVCCASIPLVDVDDAVGRGPPGQGRGLPHRLPAGAAAARPPRLAARRVGPDVGRLRRDRDGHRLPHRHRAPRRPPSAPASTTGAGAGPSSTTWRRPTAASGPSPS